MLARLLNQQVTMFYSSSEELNARDNVTNDVNEKLQDSLIAILGLLPML